jgi:hypothetical protein
MLSALWTSFCALPLWVRVWLAVILAPVNMATVLFLSEPGGLAVAALAWGGMIANLPVMLRSRGFSRAMAFPHLLFWAPLVIVIVWQMEMGAPGASVGYAAFLGVLVVVDLISLTFDARDAVLWLQGDRRVPGRDNRAG